MKITVATMDRAIWAVRLGVGLGSDNWAARDRAIYLRALEDAAKVATGPRKVEPISPFAEGYDVGHDAHVEAIRDLVRAIRKEMGR